VGSEWKPAGVLQAQLTDMLTSRSFTTVVDVGSNLLSTLPLRRRIAAGEVLGPKIYTAGAAQYPPNGIPFYVKETTPRWLQWLMPQPDTPQDAAADARRNISAGADVLKLFTGSYVRVNGKLTVKPMPVENARAAVEVAHAAGQLVYSHPSNAEGIKIAVESGVDVLAHAADDTEGVDDALLRRIVERKMWMVPTLKIRAGAGGTTSDGDAANADYGSGGVFCSVCR
jgi:imidazolonepropionase-like amidohydrolase